jgi:hypothetical protein
MKEKILDVQDTGRKLTNGASVYHVITNNEARPVLSCFSNRVMALKGTEIEEGVDFTTTSRDYQGTKQYQMTLTKKDTAGFQGKQWQGRGHSKEEQLQSLLTMVLAYSKDLVVASVEAKILKDMADIQKYTTDTFGILVPVVRKTYLSILEAENANNK